MLRLAHQLITFLFVFNKIIFINKHLAIHNNINKVVEYIFGYFCDQSTIKNDRYTFKYTALSYLIDIFFILIK